MKKLFRSRLRFVFIPIIAAAFVFLVGSLVMYLWNYTLPALFGVSAINLWQAIALFVLCKVLFGFGGGGPRRGGPPWRRRAMKRRFDRMGAEEKARMRSYMQWRYSCWADDVAGVPEENADNLTNQ